MINAKPLGGTELLDAALSSHVDTSHVNLIKSKCDWSQLDFHRPNILWQHLSYDQDNVKNFHDAAFVDKLDAVVFVSHWQHDQFRRRFKAIPGEKCHVIQNATSRREIREKPKADKIRIIYTSTPWRGLRVLAESFKTLDRDDVELVVYSGTSIYGQAFYDANNAQFSDIYAELAEMGVTHIEYGPNDEVRAELNDAHIFAYPSIWEETSCLAAIEALTAGCKVVTTNFGALYETCGVWADYVPISTELVSTFANALNQAIDAYNTPQAKADRMTQELHYNQYWTWEGRRAEQWDNLLKRFR